MVAKNPAESLVSEHVKHRTGSSDNGRKTKRLGQSPVQRSGLVCRAVSGSSGLRGDQPVSQCHQFGNEQVCDAVVVGFFLVLGACQTACLQNVSLC